MIFKVLLVDDNKAALEALRKTVPWQQLGLDVVGCAEDGIEGIKLIRERQPDIIISDIQMPEMDGLEMMELLKEELQNSRVIFITAYERIEYASRAIKLSAFDFLLKPLDNAQLVDTLKRAKESLIKERFAEESIDKMRGIIRRTRFLNALNHSLVKNGDEAFLEFLDNVPKAYFVVACETPGGITNPTLQRLEFVSFPEGIEVISAVIDGELVLLAALLTAELAKSWQSAASRVCDILQRNMLNATVAVSDIHSSAEDIHAAYEEAWRTLLQHNIYGRHTAVEFFNTPMLNQAKRSRVMELEQCSEKLVSRVSELSSEEIWSTILEKSEGHLRLIKIMMMLFSTRAMQERIESSSMADSIDETAIFELTKLKNTEEAKSWLESFLAELQKMNVPSSTNLVRQVLDYIRGDVTGGLVLNDVAAHFYVSPNYLSTLIRKETGITYRQHVINAKMALAKQMLDDSRMRVEDIAYAIGYENYISFYNIFKKMENMSPTEYRFRKQNNS